METSPVKITLEYVAKCDCCGKTHTFKYYETTSEELTKLHNAYHKFINVFKRGYVLNKCCLSGFATRQTIVAVTDVNIIKPYLREAYELHEIRFFN